MRAEKSQLRLMILSLSLMIITLLSRTVGMYFGVFVRRTKQKNKHENSSPCVFVVPRTIILQSISGKKTVAHFMVGNVDVFFFFLIIMQGN